MKILAIDPSGNYGKEGYGITGLAIMENGIITAIGDIDARDYKSELDYWNAIIKFIKDGRFDHICCEGYKLYNHKGKEAKIQANSELQTSQLIGIIKYFAYRYEIPLTIQFASEVKTRWSESVLVRLGILTEKGGRYYWKGTPTNQHKRDSMKHALHFWQYGRNKK